MPIVTWATFRQVHHPPASLPKYPPAKFPPATVDMLRLPDRPLPHQHSCLDGMTLPSPRVQMTQQPLEGLNAEEE